MKSYLPVLFLCILSAASSIGLAVDFTVAAVDPAVNQESHPAGSESRYVGKTITLLVTFSGIVRGTPDLSKINVLLRGTNTSAISGTELFVKSAENPLQWKYSFSPINDGQVDVVFSAGAALNEAGTALNAFTYLMTTDTIPAVGLAVTPNGPTLRFIATNLGGFEPTEPSPVIVNSAVLTTKNGLITSSGGSGTLFYDVTPFGYGAITLNVNPGYAADKWGNTNVLTSSTGNFPAPPGTIGTPPKIVSFIGISPSNVVYHDGDHIDFDVIFDRDVILVGIPPLNTKLPTIEMNCTGSGPNAVATALSFTGKTWHYRFVVQAGNKASLLDVESTTAFTPVADTGLTGDNISPDFIADYALPSPGSSTSLSKNFLYSINVEAAKPDPTGISGGSEPDKCAVGSGLGMMLSLGGLMLLGLLLNPLRRRC